MDIPAFPFCGLEISAKFPNLKELDNPQVIGKHLKKRRLQLRLLQADVAKILDVCEDSITGWENGRSTPQIRYYPKLIEFLGYNPFLINEKTLGGKIKQYRFQNGLSLKKFTELLEIEVRTLVNWENNSLLPTDTQFHKLKKLIKI